MSFAWPCIYLVSIWFTCFLKLSVIPWLFVWQNDIKRKFPFCYLLLFWMFMLMTVNNMNNNHNNNNNNQNNRRKKRNLYNHVQCDVCFGSVLCYNFMSFVFLFYFFFMLRSELSTTEFLRLIWVKKLGNGSQNYPLFSYSNFNGSSQLFLGHFLLFGIW